MKNKILTLLFFLLLIFQFWFSISFKYTNFQWWEKEMTNSNALPKYDSNNPYDILYWKQYTGYTKIIYDIKEWTWW